MKKVFFVLVVVTVMALLLSSCAVNFFKGFDKPTNISQSANSALNAANNGDTQTAVELSSNVITSVASSQNSTDATENLYVALTTSSTSPNAKKVIDETTKNVENVKDKLINGEISLSSTTASAVRNASIAMVRSISKIKNLSLASMVTSLIGLLPEDQSGISSVEDANSTIDASTASKIVVLLLSASRDMPTTDLLSELSSLLSVYGGDDGFNWSVSNIIYDALYASIALFDSNHDGVLTTDDEIFSYVWDKTDNRFKDTNNIDVDNMLNVGLGTYNNVSLSEEVLNKLHEAVSSAKDALNHIPDNLNVNVSSVESGIDTVNTILNSMNASKFASLATLGELVTSLENDMNH